MAAREIYRLRKLAQRGCCARWVVGVVEPHDSGLVGYVLRYCVQVGKPLVPFHERHEIGFAACEQGAHRVDGVAWIRNQSYVTWLDEGHRGVSDALFGTDEGYHLGLRIQLHVESLFVPVGDRPAELR